MTDPKPEYNYHTPGASAIMPPEWDDDDSDVIVLSHDGHEYRPHDRDDGL